MSETQPPKKSDIDLTPIGEGLGCLAFVGLLFVVILAVWVFVPAVVRDLGFIAILSYLAGLFK
jgi:hypothetical protein